MTPCSAQPISWLDLERFHLGELSKVEEERVAAHARACETCSACLRLIENDERTLRPLPRFETRVMRAVWRQFPLAFAASVATAAAIVLIASFVFLSRDDRDDSSHPQRVAFKGGDFAFTVLRERDGLVVENPKVYLSGDRFSLLVTCSSPEPVEWDVVVFFGGEVFFPLDARNPISCGNRVALPGAFRLTGSLPAALCLLVGEDLPHRQDISSLGREALPQDSICYELEPAAGESTERY